jgi:hypothetical protein
MGYVRTSDSFVGNGADASTAFVLAWLASFGRG